MTPARGESGRLGLVVHGGTLQIVAEAARRAEEAGFESVWTTEFYDRSATVSLAAMAAATERVAVGSAIMYAVGRSPLVLAVEAADLDELSGGRLILGIGTGTRRMQADWHSADPAHPAARVEELVPLLRTVWAMGSDGVDHQGRFYRLRLRPTGYGRTPLRERIPVYTAGVNPRMITAAGRVADGLVGHPIFTPRYVSEVVRPTLADAATSTGRERPAAIAGYVICAIHDDRDLARREAKAQIAFYSLVRTYDVIMRLHGFEAAAGDAREAWRRSDRDGMIAAISDEMCDTMAVAGSADEVLDAYADRYDGVYERPLLYAPSYGVPAERFAESLDAILDTFTAPT